MSEELMTRVQDLIDNKVNSTLRRCGRSVRGPIPVT